MGERPALDVPRQLPSRQGDKVTAHRPSHSFRVGTPFLLAAMATVLVGCGPAQSAVSAPKPLGGSAPSGARWFFPGPVVPLSSSVHLGTGGRLAVGKFGTRFILTDTSSEAAGSLLPESLCDVAKRDSHYVFLGCSGTTYTASEPLGPFKRLADGPSLPKGRSARSAALGAKSAFVVDTGGEAWRTKEPGQAWTSLAAPTAAGFRYESVAADAHGLTLLLAIPQRALVSIDDGATLLPLPTPGIGASGAYRAPSGLVTLEGATKSAVLRSGPLGFDTPKPTEPARKTEFVGAHRLFGNQQVVLGSSVLGSLSDPQPKLELELLVGTFGTKLAKRELPLLEGNFRVMLARSAPTPTLAMEHYTKAQGSLIDVYASKDVGQTWTKLAVFPGTQSSLFSSPLFVGPNNLVVLSDVCRDSEDGTRICGTFVHRSGVWERLAVDGVIRQAVFDASRNRAWLLGTKGYAGTADLKTLAPDAKLSAARSATVDEKGVLRFLTNDGYRERLHEIGLDGSVANVDLFHEFDVALSGRHGFALDRKSLQGWETADGGHRWSRVALGARALWTCAEVGCLFEDGVARVGWDDVSGSTPASEVESTALVDTATSVPAGSALGATLPPLVTPDMECVPEGPWQKIGSRGVEPASGEVSWYSIDRSEDRVSLHMASRKGGVVEERLFGNKPGKKWQTRIVTVADDNGVAVARLGYDDGPKGVTGPIDVELGWLSFEKGTIHRATILDVPNFNLLAAWMQPAMTVIAGGWLVLSIRDQPVRLVSPAGVVRELPRPDGLGTVAHGTVVGWKVRLVSAGTAVEVFDWNNSWSERTWNLGRSVTVHRTDDGLVAFDGGQLAMPVGDATDPPDWELLPMLPKPAMCSVPELGGIVQQHPTNGHVTIVDKGEKLTLQMASGSYRRSKKGACLATVATVHGPFEAFVELSGFGRSWLVQSEGAGKRRVRPLRCK